MAKKKQAEQPTQEPTEQTRFLGSFTGSKGQGFELRKIPSGGVDLRILHRNKVQIHLAIGEEMLAQLKIAFSHA